MHSPTASRNSLVFIDSQVVNANEPSEDVASEVEVIFKDATNNGVAPNREARTRHTKVSSIHIIIHGQAGSWQLEPTRLNQQMPKMNFAACVQS